MTSKKTILLTGATGNMGGAALDELLRRSERFRVKALALPSDKNHPVLKRHARNPNLEIVWGDLTRYEDVLRGVTGADQVLHIGGLVSPVADRVPELTMKVNVGGARNIVRAILDQPNRDQIRLVYIGTVAQTGHRAAPIHWGRTGDPIKISRYDQYAVSKTQAEAIVAESGLQHWVSLRQTGIAHPQLWQLVDPIMFHSPFNCVLEWVTVGDSGRLAANLCEDTVPNGLWRSFYNISGGECMRVVNHEFAAAVAAAMGIKDFRKMFRPQWFATRNFHGQWYTDADRLESLVPFRSESLPDFIAQLREAIPLYVKVGARLATSAGRRRIERLAEGEGGPLYWLRHDDRDHIDAYFGSRAEWAKIPDWDHFVLEQPSRVPTELDHGYAERKTPDQWTLADLRQAAEFRGGSYLSSAPLSPYDETAQWRCARGHDFAMSSNLMLRGGHWCPTCMIDPNCYPEVAERSPFFAQVWRNGC